MPGISRATSRGVQQAVQAFDKVKLPAARWSAVRADLEQLLSIVRGGDEPAIRRECQALRERVHPVHIVSIRSLRSTATRRAAGNGRTTVPAPADVARVIEEIRNHLVIGLLPRGAARPAAPAARRTPPRRRT